MPIAISLLATLAFMCSQQPASVKCSLADVAKFVQEESFVACTTLVQEDSENAVYAIVLYDEPEQILVKLARRKGDDWSELLSETVSAPADGPATFEIGGTQTSLAYSDIDDDGSKELLVGVARLWHHIGAGRSWHHTLLYIYQLADDLSALRAIPVYSEDVTLDFFVSDIEVKDGPPSIRVLPHGEIEVIGYLYPWDPAKEPIKVARYTYGKKESGFTLRRIEVLEGRHR